MLGLNAEFLLSMGEPPHPELDKAILDGDDARVIEELTRARNHYLRPGLTLNTAIECAIESERLKVLNVLLENGVQAEDCNMQTAITRGNIPIVTRLLTELPGSINKVFDYGHTALSYA